MQPLMRNSVECQSSICCGIFLDSGKSGFARDNLEGSLLTTHSSIERLKPRNRRRGSALPASPAARNDLDLAVSRRKAAIERPYSP